MYRQKYLFLLPGLLVQVAIILFPLLFTVSVSFSSRDVYNPSPNWIGAENYGRLWNDVRCWEALLRLTGLTVGTVLLHYTLGFALGLLVWRRGHGAAALPRSVHDPDDVHARGHVGPVAHLS